MRGKGLPTTNAYLDQRQAALDGLRILASLERWLATQGVGAGTIDWGVVLPQLHALSITSASSYHEASATDRYRTFLHALANEVASRPGVNGATATAAQLAPLLHRYAAALPVAEMGNTVTTHSEAFLDRWAPRIAGLQFVPPGFDLHRLKPMDSKTTLEAHRLRIIAEFKRTKMPNLVVQYVRDHWSHSQQDQNNYLKRLDMGALRKFVVARMTDAFVDLGKTDPAYRRALASAARDQTRFDTVQRLLVQAQQLEANHQRLEQRLRSSGPGKNDADDAIAANPAAYYESASTLAAMTTTILSTMQRGGDLRAFASIPSTDVTRMFGAVTLLVALGSAIQNLRAEQENQSKETRRDLERDLDLQYADVARIVQTMWDDAENWISETYIPKLKEVAIRILTKNRNDLAAWERNFETETPRIVAGYKMAAFALRDLAKKLKSGEVTSATLEGHVFTIKDVETLTHAAQTMTDLGERLGSKEGAKDKRDELKDAIGAFDRTKERIEDGKYPAWSWGPTVAKIARAELGVGEFPPYATYDQVFTGKAQASENPFIARAIAGWQFREKLEAEFRQVAVMAGLGLLTVASLLVPGVGGAILAVIDIGANIIHAKKGYDEAKAALDLALLDPDLKLKGVTVEQARKALRDAKIAMALSIIIPAGIAAFAALIIWRFGRGAKQLGSGFKNLDAAFKTDPVKVQQLLDIVQDTQKLDKLLGITKDVKLLDNLLLHAESAVNLERFLAKIPDAKKLSSMLEHAGSAKRLSSVLDHVADSAQLERLASVYKNDYAKLESHLAKLAAAGDKTSSAARLEGLLKKVGGLDKLQPLLRTGGDIGKIEKLLETLKLDKLTSLLGEIKSVERLEELLKHIKDVEQLERLLKAAKGPDKLLSLLEHAKSPAILERVLARTSSAEHAADLFKAFGKQVDLLDKHIIALGANPTAGKRLSDLLGRTKDVATLDKLVTRAGGNIVGLEKLLLHAKAKDLVAVEKLLSHPKVTDLAALETLLGHAKISDVAALEKLLGNAKITDAAQLQRLLDSPIVGHGTQLERLLANAKLASGLELEKLVGLVDGGARLERLLGDVANGTKLIELLTKAGGSANAARLESLIKLAHGRDPVRIERLLNIAGGNATKFEQLFKYTEWLSKRKPKLSYAPPPQVAAHGFTGANMPHFLDHTWEYVDLPSRWNKAETSFWRLGTKPTEISKYLGEALDVLNPSGSTLRRPVAGSPSTASTSGGLVQVGSKHTGEIGQFFLPGGTKLVRDEMRAIIKILEP